MMAKLTTNKLFHRKTLNRALQNFTFPHDLASKQQKLESWIISLQKGALDEVKEVSLHGQFLNDIFQDILGYRSITQGKGKTWEIEAETTIADGGGTADAALGFFSTIDSNKSQRKLEKKIIAPIELKGAKTSLDRPTPGRKESAVEQGWRYANYTPDCQWIIVSNYRELRLYHTNKTPAYYEQFLLKDLADIEQFKQFYFLLCRQNFLPLTYQSDQPSIIERLLRESNEAEAEITKKLYQEYRQVRLDLTRHFQHTAPKDIVNRDQVLIEKAQKTLDRILFIAFCEDRGLLPQHTIQQAHDYKDSYNPRSIWDNYQAVFRWVDQGNNDPLIPGYNGGLFKFDPLLDQQLQVSDVLCSLMKQLTQFDFDTEVSVDILGRIFEQSITDLEELKALASGQAYNQKQGKRKTQGVFYTPAFITQYIVEVALGGYLAQKEVELRNSLQLRQISQRATKKQKEAEIKFWETYRDEVLKKTKIVDPACGSGAFLIAAFDYLAQKYEDINQILADLKGGQRSVFDLNKTILNHNLYGVDLSAESVEITKLSLWLKTAEPGKSLTYLDDNIKVGNSIIADSRIDARAFDWQAEFSDIFAEGGFDVVIGNPPYVRQELLSPLKPYLEKHYQTYHGVADLYTYFYEKGVNLLKDNGILSYIVTNKWFRSGYGEALRKFFTESSIVEQIIDFGHAPIFEDADTFPCIVSVRKVLYSNQLSVTSNEFHPPQPPLERGENLDSIALQRGEFVSPTVLICPIPREKLANINLNQYIKQAGYHIPWSQFSGNIWSLERPEITLLMEKIKKVSIPLQDFIRIKPFCGVKTGLNEAFCIDNETRNNLIKADSKATEIIKPYLRGQDLKRWCPEWQNLWMIFAHKNINIDNYPSIKNHLLQYQDKLAKRAGKQLWWQLQASPAFYHLFEQPKIIYQEINTFPCYAIDCEHYYINGKVFLLPVSDLYLIGCLNSPLGWWISHQIFPKMIGDAVTPRGDLMIDFPIAAPTTAIRAESEEIVNKLIEITKSNQQIHRDVLDWLHIEHKIDKLNRKLEDFASLNADEFVAEIKKLKPKAASGISITQLREIRDAYNQYAPTIQQHKVEALRLECRLSDLVNQAYQLTPEEIDLMWKTAPPRMPINRE